MHSDEQEIRQLVTTWMGATKAGDIETVLALMTDDAVFLAAGRSPMMGKSAFAAASTPQRGKDAPKFDGTSNIREIKVLGDWAYMWTELSVVATVPGGSTPVMRAGHTLSILRKQAGKWLLVRDANMLMQMPGPAA